jgi:hypothetical protein
VYKEIDAVPAEEILAGRDLSIKRKYNPGDKVLINGIQTTVLWFESFPGSGYGADAIMFVELQPEFGESDFEPSNNSWSYLRNKEGERVLFDWKVPVLDIRLKRIIGWYSHGNKKWTVEKVRKGKK